MKLVETGHDVCEAIEGLRGCDKISNKKTNVVVFQLTVDGEWNIDPDEIANTMAVQTLERTGTNDLTFSQLL